ncbi:MAG: AbiV family abortive infection protein [Bacteroidales bacterium]|nr:AbiV family abortive infection protein [Bacteroidales bacterium]
MEEQNNLPSGVKKTLIMNKLNGIDNQANEVYLKIYLASIAEAYSLLKEAELLYNNKFFQRAYFLGISALEEISKSQMAADVFTGFIKEDEFKKAYRDHQKKISRIKWIKIDGNSFPFFSYDNVLIENFDFQKKIKSMYVDIDFDLNEISTPNDSITENDAKSIVKAVKIGLYRIYQVTEEFGEQIGTKVFMK